MTLKNSKKKTKQSKQCQENFEVKKKQQITVKPGKEGMTQLNSS